MFGGTPLSPVWWASRRYFAGGFIEGSRIIPSMCLRNRSSCLCNSDRCIAGLSWRPDRQCIHFDRRSMRWPIWCLCAGVSSPRGICLCHLAPLLRPFLHHLAHPLVVLVHSGVLRRAGHKSLSNGLVVFRLTDDKRRCGTHPRRIPWNLSLRMAACGARAPVTGSAAP